METRRIFLWKVQHEAEDLNKRRGGGSSLQAEKRGRRVKSSSEQEKSMGDWMDGWGDDRQRIYRTRLKAHLWSVSGGAQTDGRFNCQKKKGLDIFRQRPFSHSEFNLCSVGSSDFVVRLNPGAYLSTLLVDRWGREKEQRRLQEEDLQTMTLGRRGKAVEWSYERQSP